jgi:uncharacterized membrane protein YqjE
VATTTGGTPETSRKRSLLALLTDIPVLVRELVVGEIELLKQEMIRKLKALGIGAGLIFGAAIVLLGMIGVLLTAAVLGLAEVMPGWLAALLVAALLLIIAVILGLVGYRVLKKGIPPLPTQTIDGLKKDLNVIKGVGKRE